LPKVTNVTNSNGVRLLASLFLETAKQDRGSAPYTLKDYDYEWKGQVYPSLYVRYMGMQDPIEFNFANEYLADFQHWELLCETKWFQPYAKRWRKELELQLKANSLARVLAESKAPTREGISAAKYVLEKGWEPKDRNTKGRPTKQDIKDEAYKIATDNKLVNEHFEKFVLKDTSIKNKTQ